MHARIFLVPLLPIFLPLAGLLAQAPASSWKGSMNMSVPKEARFAYGLQRFFAGAPGEFIAVYTEDPFKHRVVRFSRADGSMLGVVEWVPASKVNGFKQVETLLPLGGKLYAVETQRPESEGVIHINVRPLDPTTLILGDPTALGSVQVGADGLDLFGFEGFSRVVEANLSPDGKKGLVHFGGIKAKAKENAWFWYAVLNDTGTPDHAHLHAVPRPLPGVKHTALVNNTGEVFVRAYHYAKKDYWSEDMRASIFKVGTDGSRSAELQLEAPTGMRLQSTNLLGMQGGDLLIGGTLWNGEGDAKNRSNAVLWRVDMATGTLKDMDSHDLVKENKGERVEYLMATSCHALPDGRLYLVAQSERFNEEPINGTVFVLLLNADGSAVWVRRLDRLAAGVAPLGRAGRIVPVLVGERLVILSNDSPDNITRRAAGENVKNITTLGGNMIPIATEFNPAGEMTTTIFEDLRAQGHMLVTTDEPFTVLRGEHDLWMTGYEKMAKLVRYPLHLQWE